MKSLDDSLRDEFNKILTDGDYSEKIKSDELDKTIIDKAFDVLLNHRSTPDRIENAKTEFENYIINTIKTNAYKNGNQ
jgi:hypothetical protein